MINSSLLIMAAGMGSRFGGKKQFAPVGPNGEIILDYSICDALECGFDRIIIVIRSDMRPMLEMRYGELFKKHEIIFCDQEYDTLPSFFTPPEGRVKPYGTSHALMCAAQFIDYPTLIINADDFYGKETFRNMNAFLNTIDNYEAGIAVYPLCRTLSSNGPVTRGICGINNDSELISITETYEVASGSDGVIRSRTDISLPPNAPTSMNVWAVTPEFHRHAQLYFDDFFNRLSEDDLTSELPLPVMIDRMIKDKQINVKAIPVNSDWLGITYPLDLPYIKEKIRLLHDDGTYPSPLFE